MKSSREFYRTPRRLPPSSDVSVLQKTRMSHFGTRTIQPFSQNSRTPTVAKESQIGPYNLEVAEVTTGLERMERSGLEPVAYTYCPQPV